MPNKFNYLINEKLEINGRKIYCKVTGNPGSANDGQPYVIAITGGPGFGHSSTEAYIKKLIRIAKKSGATLPHFIFFDHIGCGQSDPALNYDKEYTVDHFTDVAADLVQAIKQKLNVPKMNLFVEGGSFGSMVAMNFPARKPEWLEPNSDIQIKQITSKVGPRGAGEWEYTKNFLENLHLENHDEVLNAQKKLFTGDLKDRADYIVNFVLPMASLYAKDVDKSYFNKFIKTFVVRYPESVVKTLDYSNRFLKKLGIELGPLSFADEILGKCSLDVLNHFFKNDFNGFDVIETIKRNIEIYSRIPICLISASKDHVVDYHVALDINKLLPNTSAAIIFDEPHMLSKGPNQKIYHQLNYDLLVTGSIPVNHVDYPMIKCHTLNEEFNKKLAIAHVTTTPGLAKFQTTAMLLTSMPQQEKNMLGMLEANHRVVKVEQENVKQECPQIEYAPVEEAKSTSLQPKFA